jgi:cytochrome c oxidase subunit 2
VPVNKKIRIITTANDVIHAFAVPVSFNKQDAIPVLRAVWFRAAENRRLYGQCQELCAGKERAAYMPIHVSCFRS